jgi:hypothetical protein
VFILIPWRITWHFSSGLRNPTPSYILQASLFNSPEKSFLLPVYVEAVACASPPRRPTCVPRRRHVGDPRVLNFLDINATVEASLTADCSNSGCSSLSGTIFEHCNDDSMFAFVLPVGLLSFLLPFRFAVRLLGPPPLICMMVFLSSRLYIFLNANLLLHFIVLHHIFLHHCMARTRGKTCHFLYY